MNSLKNIILEQSRYYYDPSWSPDPEGESPIIDGLSKFDPMEYAWNSTTETYWVKKNTEDDDKWRNLILYSNYDKLKLKLDKAIEQLKIDDADKAQADADAEAEEIEKVAAAEKKAAEKAVKEKEKADAKAAKEKEKAAAKANKNKEIIRTTEVKRENKTLKYDDGSVYVGEVIVKDGKDIRDGKLSKLTMPDGSKYFGEFKDDNFINGTYTFTNSNTIYADAWGIDEQTGAPFIKDGSACRYDELNSGKYYDRYEGTWDQQNQRLKLDLEKYEYDKEFKEINPTDNTNAVDDEAAAKKKAAEDAKLKADAEAEKKAAEDAEKAKKKEVVKTDPAQKAIASNYLLQKQFVANLAVQLNNDKKLREKFKKGSEIMTSVQNYYNDKFPLIKTGNSSILKQNNKNIITWINLMRPKLNGGTNFTVDINLINPTTNKTEKTTVTINVF